ncbi:hypothetical protein [Dyadobacter sp. LHD-138]|uniref:hypothetical protein n=1 Tax=Dyadobacter sp. LHD-138 TaxID=3071413 RepID=UPI0027E180EB|nr:hypothetical protein [Dyadobacter sp. LHD-138]MDQ6482238.1 hypothetical protein [Dyadobacter sp. LHD-138]
MEEILRNLGVKVESWIISFMAASIFIVMKIYEPEIPPTKRKVIYIILSGIATALLVPGLIVYWFGIDNPFAAGFATAVVVMTFELIAQAIKDRVIKKIKDEKDGI